MQTSSIRAFPVWITGGVCCAQYKSNTSEIVEILFLEKQQEPALCSGDKCWASSAPWARRNRRCTSRPLSMSSSILIYLSHSSQEGQSHLAFHSLGPRVNKYSVLGDWTKCKVQIWTRTFSKSWSSFAEISKVLLKFSRDLCRLCHDTAGQLISNDVH